MKLLLKIIALLASFAFFCFAVYVSYFGSVGKSTDRIIFVIPQDYSSFSLTDSLFEQKLIKNKKVFQFLFNNFLKNREIKAGGYKLSQSMSAWQILKKIEGKQDLLWLNINNCLRKEQIGEKLADTLDWNNTQLDDWNSLYSETEYAEGVYYPDTYLIPIDESVEQIAKRFINRFNEKFAPLSDQFISKNIKWTTGIKIASLIAREAAGKEDAKVISGVIWNRLNTNMRLQIDATMQYTLGKNKNGNWWGSIDLEQKQLNSPYNSYKNEGLPPTPICSPSIDFIEASLNPEETDCIYYLHDSSRQIHCSKTYSEHLQNIDKFLN